MIAGDKHFAIVSYLRMREDENLSTSYIFKTQWWRWLKQPDIKHNTICAPVSGMYVLWQLANIQSTLVDIVSTGSHPCPCNDDKPFNYHYLATNEGFIN